LIQAFHQGRYFEAFSSTPLTCASSSRGAMYVFVNTSTNPTTGVKVTISNPTDKGQAANAVMPEGFKLDAYPNPFAGHLNFRVLSPVSGMGKLEVFNASGQLIRTIFKENVIAGVPMNAVYKSNSVDNSLLIYKFTVGNQSFTGKAVSIR
jgi:hypothetical protein